MKLLLALTFAFVVIVSLHIALTSCSSGSVDNEVVVPMEQHKPSVSVDESDVAQRAQGGVEGSGAHPVVPVESADPAHPQDPKPLMEDINSDGQRLVD